jgi:phosphoribosylanthranilate isomerase
VNKIKKIKDMKTIEEARTDYVNSVVSLVTSNKISIEDADKIFTAVREYMDAVQALITNEL